MALFNFISSATAIFSAFAGYVCQTFSDRANIIIYIIHIIISSAVSND